MKLRQSPDYTLKRKETENMRSEGLEAQRINSGGVTSKRVSKENIEIIKVK